MMLESIEASALEIPFTVAFKHASAERSCTETIWVEARARAEAVGYGEGRPRHYVSGESLATTLTFVQAHRTEWMQAVRADANNLWNDADTALRALAALDFPFRALEEPLRAGDVVGMRRIAVALGTRIVVDESLLRTEQLDRFANEPDRRIVNLRVSKMGGLLRSLELVREARRRSLSVILGAHVGETSVLTRAALTLAHHARDILVAQEGAFGTHLLSEDVARPPLMFGAGGIVDIPLLKLRSGAGLGLEIFPPVTRHQ